MPPTGGHHRHGLVVTELEGECTPDAALDDIAHPEWFDLGSEVEAGARLRGVPSTRGSDVAAVAGEITEVGEEGRECFFVFLAQDLVESA